MPRVFVSYSQDSGEHSQRVLALALSLRDNGMTQRDLAEKVSVSNGLIAAFENGPSSRGPKSSTRLRLS